MRDGGVPFQAFDALPLASEPFAALVDLVLAVARTGGTRESAIALLRSPLVSTGADGGDAAALEQVLFARQATGDGVDIRQRGRALGGRPRRPRRHRRRARASRRGRGGGRGGRPCALPRGAARFRAGGDDRRVDPISLGVISLGVRRRFPEV